MTTLRDDAIRIWQAGVDAVDSTRLVADQVDTSDGLSNCGRSVAAEPAGRLVVVGAGKAAAGMAAGFEQALQDSPWLSHVEGWVNVPADCVRTLERIHLHAGRPAGLNEPTQAGIDGSRRILDLVGSLNAGDTCVVMISGGGSALLPCPVDEVTLEDKRTVTRLLSTRGAGIVELNAVRTRLSRIKGGGLARACGAGTMIVMIISDVIGDPLDVIASGPTIVGSETGAAAEDIFRRYIKDDEVSPAVIRALRDGDKEQLPAGPKVIEHHIIGNIRTAMDAASAKARELGYTVQDAGDDNTGNAGEYGTAMAETLLKSRDTLTPHATMCIVSGGEPVVDLSNTGKPGRGGRNQELVLAATLRWWDEPNLDGLLLLSGGTDGEDGPTDAAGGLVDADTIAIGQRQGLSPQSYLARHDAYPFLEAVGGLLRTGPTHTNVMDLRIGLVRTDGTFTDMTRP